jgi:hypothetical protein
MKYLAGLFGLGALLAGTVAMAQSEPPPASAIQSAPNERLGTVSFVVSCAPSQQANFNRGVALLHDFWYEEARRQFEQITASDPNCAMAHWGIAMSVFHQIWDRPDDAAVALGWQHLQMAQAHPAKTPREREYVAALSNFFRPDKRSYQGRIDDYAAAMGELYVRHPRDVDAGAFYALSLLAAESPDDVSLKQERKAMVVLEPLFPRFPDHPGVIHYIIHACDTPSLAPSGLGAAQRYGVVASSGPHAVHMPGHIFARLGMWQEDVDSQRASIAASHAAESRHQSGAMDQFHSYDFLMYAYLQSGQDAGARQVLADSAAALTHVETMPTMGEGHMAGMVPYYRTKLPVFYHLEMRDWATAAALEPVDGALPETQTLTYWGRAVGAGHLRQAQQAGAALTAYDALIEKVKQGRHAYLAESTSEQITRGEILAWAAFAEGESSKALEHMRDSADLQDKVGQGEVDIPAREMLADMLLELERPKEALAEYKLALALSPNRYNGLFNAGLAAEAVGDKGQAEQYFAALLKSTASGSQSSRPELDHAKTYLTSARVAVQ